MKYIVVLDNNGQTFDRYTIINKITGDVWGASENPFHPQGFGQYSHNIADSYWFHAYGAAWRKRCNVTQCIKDAVKNYLADCSNIGKKVKIDSLPTDVIKYIQQIAN